MDNFQLLKSRRSVREFSDKSISREDLARIIDAARFAPTAKNVQPWEFVVITDRNMLKSLAELAENGRFMAFAAAAVAVFSIDSRYYLEDGCGATCNILLAATALEIGSCWVAGDKKPYCGQVSALLNASQDLKLVSLIALGYPREEGVFKESLKRPLDSLMRWEKF